jgi:hypothetical protein
MFSKRKSQIKRLAEVLEAVHKSKENNKEK